MSLDFGIERKRKGEAYESDSWEDVVWGRNCWAVRNIVLENISTYDEEKYEAKLTIGTLNNLVIKLAESLNNYNLNKKTPLQDDRYVKTLDFISGLSRGIYEHCIDYEYHDIDYDYKLVDSY